MEEFKLYMNTLCIPEIPTSEIDNESVFSFSNFQVKTVLTEDFDDKQRKASTANDDLIVDRRVIEESEERYEGTTFETERKPLSIKTDKYKYIGEVSEGEMRDGFGICYYSKGEIYIGQWRNGKKHGFGKTIFPNGHIFQGEICNNYYEGFVEMNVPGKFSIQGFVLDNKFLEEVIIKRGGITIEGVINNQSFCVCKIIYSEDHYFIGEVDGTLSNGVGISVFKKNFIYSGFFRDNKSFGYGEIIYSDGSRYYGYFEENKRHGVGFHFTKDGKMTFGYYFNDIKDGAFITINKSSFKLEVYHLGFRAKIVEKVETCKKYLLLNYPEFSHILKINYKNIYDRFVEINDELACEVVVNEI
jgi:hypothetical protein